MLNERKSWNNQQDQMLKKLYQQNREKIQSQTIHWNYIAQSLNQLRVGPIRTGKQCRQRYSIIYQNLRWFNQLNPEINKNGQWNEDQKNQLIELHDVYGNKWALIAKYLHGRTDNSIKNFMNSTLRKGLRVLNLFVSKNRKFTEFKFKNLKQYKTDLLNKILFFAGNKNSDFDFQEDFLLSTFTQNKQLILAKVYRLCAQIKRELMSLQDEHLNGNLNFSQKKLYIPIHPLENLIQKIHELNAICKKRKQKKSKWNKRVVKESHIPSFQRKTQILKLHKSLTQGQTRNLYNFLRQAEQKIEKCFSSKESIYSDKTGLLTLELKQNSLDQKKTQVIQTTHELQRKQNPTQQIQNDSRISVDSDRQNEKQKNVNLRIQKFESVNLNGFQISKKQAQMNRMGFIESINQQKENSMQKRPHNSKVQKKLTIQSQQQLTCDPKFFAFDEGSMQIQSSSISQDIQYYMISELVENSYLPVYPTYCYRSEQDDIKVGYSSVVDINSIQEKRKLSSDDDFI